MTITDNRARPTAPDGSLAARLSGDEEHHLLALFPGQDAHWRAALDAALVGRPGLRAWIDDVLTDLDEWAASVDVAQTGAFPDGIRNPFAVGEAPALAPLGTLLTDLVSYAALTADGLPTPDAALGQGVGMLAAWVASCSPAQPPAVEDVRDVARLALRIGALSITHPSSVPASVVAAARAGDAQARTPMAVVTGPSTQRLAEFIAPDGEVVIATVASPFKHVLSGPASALAALRMELEAQERRQAAERTSGRRGGAPLSHSWTPLPVALGIQHPGLLEDSATLDFRLPRGPAFPVIDPAAGDAHAPDAGTILGSQVDWPSAVRAASRPGGIAVAVSPLSDIAEDTRESLQGAAVIVLDPSTAADREVLFRPGAEAARPLDYRRFAPRVVRSADGQLRIENRHTLRSGRSPVILPGMTPTTVEAPIVAAAANAGHVAELAGGGQVSERIFTERVAELGELLEPGHEVVLNTLFLDPYLWGMQVGRDRLAFKARAAGAPICGLTVSAGIPEPEEGTRLLDELHAAGMWLNAFKPGTAAQVEAALRIADATEHTIWLHLEGGAAGGHHSWEDLDQLLLATYPAIRERDNVILAVGGGIGDPQRAGELLSGSWAHRYSMLAMPVDAVLLGTLAMATKEAATSPSVKLALTAADGHDGWVLRHDVSGGTTSGVSQLGADIHYLDNSASAAARLLDGVAGDEAAVTRRRGEIIDALSRTAKPYFGDLDDLTYERLLTRFVELTALGRGGRYEDGAWLDVAHRTRFQALLQRAEARLSEVDSGPVPTLFGDLSSLDDPHRALASLLDAHPVAFTALLHPADAAYFVVVAGWAGKPVPFVPVIDASVRRWYLSDALWQAHDDRYDADQVLVIPGPVALAGITKPDEPIADLLNRFEAIVAEHLETEAGSMSARATRIGDPVQAALWSPTWLWLGETRANPLRRIAPPEKWERSIDLSSGSPGSSRAQWCADGQTASLRETSEGVELTLTWPGLGLPDGRVRLNVTVRKTSGVPIVEVDEDALAGAGEGLLTGAADLPEPTAGAHAATVGGVGRLPDAAMRRLWPAIFGSLAENGLSGVMFDLVHLRHEITGRATQEHATAQRPVVSRAPGGLVVQVASQSGDVASLDRFFVRRARPAEELKADPGSPNIDAIPTPAKTVGTLSVTAPARLESFAAITGDLNPIHRSDVLARFAGLPGRIVHGMWTSAAASRAVIELAADGDPTRIRSWTIDFAGYVLPGQRVDITVRRTALRDGARVLSVEAATDDGIVALGTAVVAPPRTIYVFPGQGIQSQGMGMDGYERSKAARGVWDEADRITREQLGFSILQIVRDNPTSLTAQGVDYRHPAGVLFLTQFTQVAMTTLAQAQVAELKEAGAFDPTAAIAGHSVGEYNGLAALTDALPLRACINLVFARGQGMHGLVPRDDQGRSDYLLGVVRPHLAGLSHEQAEGLVAEVAASTGELCQIANHNLRGKQYAVAGTRSALDELGRRLGPGRPGKAPLLFVPGIDVPFHSSALLNGVDGFREQLEQQLPARIKADDLIGRYIPNLYPVVFRLDRDYVQGIRDACESGVLDAVLADWEAASADRDTLARTVLCELLAWQFASPVRWIESFDLMCAPLAEGGLAIERFIEVGVGSAPTLANLAKGSLALASHRGNRPEVLNIEVDANVFDNDPDPVAEPVAALVDAEPAEAEPTAVAISTTGAAATPEMPVDSSTALRALLCLRAGIRPDQLGQQSIEDLVDGASSRRNQVLMDLGKEFAVPAIDGAHEAQLPQLIEGLGTKARHYRYPGPVLTLAVDSGVTTALGRFGASPSAVAKRVAGHWGLGAGWVARAALALTLGTRQGSSRRGGDLADLVGGTADELIDSAVLAAGAQAGIALAPAAAESGGGTVDAAAVEELRQEFHGMLTEQASDLLLRVQGPSAAPDEPDPALSERLATLEREHGSAARIEPLFDQRRHVHLASAGHWAVADIDHLVQGSLAGRNVSALVDQIVVHRDAEPRVERALRHHVDRLTDSPTVALLNRCLTAAPTGIAIPDLTELPVPAEVKAAAEDLVPGRFTGQIAVVTGASPGSIADAAVAHLLRGGATVVLTTSNDSRARISHYRELERRCAGPGAQLHVVRANLASFTDIDRFLDWLVTPTTDTSGPVARAVKPALWPTLVLPFAASPSTGTVADAGSDAALTLRLLVLGVQRLIGTLAERGATAGAPVFTAVLPQSPNLGIFGGDGSYAESKAALLTLRNRWHSEAQSWGHQTRLIGAQIGWVRGTGLMGANDGFAQAAREQLGIATFSAQQMGGLIAALCTDGFAAQAAREPIDVNLTGGLDALDSPNRLRDLILAPLDGSPDPQSEPHNIAALPNLPADLLTAREDLPEHRPAPTSPDDMIVIAGVAEYGPWGASSTRHQAELGGLSASGVVELAWRTGLVSCADGVWEDAATGDPVPESDLAATYREQVAQRVGIRPYTTTEDVAADGYTELTPVYLDRPWTKVVPTRSQATALAGERGTVSKVPEGWQVTLPAGSSIRVERRIDLPRSVGGQFPLGSDPARHGVETGIAESIDPMAAWNLITTSDALNDAGVSPEELLEAVHPGLIGNTQGSGMGGMHSLNKTLLGPVIAADNPNDILQEALGNVVAAHTNQSLIGGYGPMVHPVAACASAAVSLEEAVDKIALGKADVVVAGGWDDLATADIIGFADMSATADNAALIEAGLEPSEHSRPGDRRRAGFVDSQGGGTFIVCRGSVALALGLPVRAVVAYAGSFGDGLHTSIPAPGLGTLGAGRGGADSQLGRALARHGLSHDDIAVVSKHDTSTQANDPNEAFIHSQLARSLGRAPGAGMRVVSQKALTGHAKGGAAAWQIAGVCDLFATGLVPGNPNLVSPDPQVTAEPLVVDYRPLHRAEPVRAALVTSLGFGHVSALVALAHPDVFTAGLDDQARGEYLRRARERRVRGARARLAATYGGPAVFRRRTRDAQGVGQRAEESVMLLDPDARISGDS